MPETIQELEQRVGNEEYANDARLKIAELILDNPDIDQKQLLKARTHLEYLVGVNLISEFNDDDLEEYGECEFTEDFVQAVDLLVIVYLLVGRDYQDKLENLGLILMKFNQNEKYRAIYEIGVNFFDEDLRASFLGENVRQIEMFKNCLSTTYNSNQGMDVREIFNKYDTIKKDYHINIVNQ